MVDPVSIGPVQPADSNSEPEPAQAADQVKGSSFQDILERSIEGVNELQHDAQEKIKGLYTGEIKDLHQVMLAIEDADMAFRLTMEMRNKILEAYQELMRMQV